MFHFLEATVQDRNPCHFEVYLKYVHVVLAPVRIYETMILALEPPQSYTPKERRLPK